jgi:hypothetical protein
MLNKASSRLPAAAPLQSEIAIEIEAEIEPSLSELAGELTAALACLVAQSLSEFKQDGRMGAETKQNGGVLISGLLELKWAYTELDFDRVMREHGTRLLRERYSDDVIGAKGIDRLVAEAINVVNRISKLKLS